MPMSDVVASVVLLGFGLFILFDSLLAETKIERTAVLRLRPSVRKQVMSVNKTSEQFTVSLDVMSS